MRFDGAWVSTGTMDRRRATQKSINSFVLISFRTLGFSQDANRPVFSGLRILEGKNRGWRTLACGPIEPIFVFSPHTHRASVSFRIIPHRYLPPRVDAFLLLC